MKNNVINIIVLIILVFINSIFIYINDEFYRVILSFTYWLGPALTMTCAIKIGFSKEEKRNVFDYVTLGVTVINLIVWTILLMMGM